MLLDLPILKKGDFYYVKESSTDIVLEDKTKRGLEIKERSVSELNVMADMGVIYDMDGIGHRVPIRWFFPKSDFSVDRVMVHALAMEKRYTDLRELTCPDD